MSRRGENIFRRSDGRWEARYVKGREPSGKIRYGYCYGATYQEAKQKAMIARAECTKEDAGETAPDPEKEQRRSKIRMVTVCEEWMEMQKGRVKESTYAKYESVVRNHILPALGFYTLEELCTEDVERFKRNLLLLGLSSKTVKDVLIVLHGAVRYARRKYPELLQNVEIAYPREVGQEERILSVEEQRILSLYLCTDMDECKFGVLLALFTGLRIGELCALRWRDISLKNQTIRIVSTLQRLKVVGEEKRERTRIRIGSPKSDSSCRTIPIPESMAGLCGRMDPGDPAAYVLTGTYHYMEPRTLQYRLAKYTQECGIKEIHFHTLRHTFATRSVELGFELKSLSEILGHSTPTITIRRYVHSSMQMKKENMNRVAGAVMTRDPEQE